MTPKSRRGALLFALALVCFGVFSIKVVSQPIVWLVRVVPDDAFYYLQIARHLADSGRSTFDGVTTTNGYHPGWMLLLTILARLIRNRELLLRSSLGLALLIHLSTSVLLVHICRRWINAFSGWVAGACWLLNPLPLLLAIQVMEASLHVLALTVAVLTFEKRIATPMRVSRAREPALHDLAAFGGSLCLVFWARTDGIVLALMSLIWVAGLLRLHPGPRPFFFTYLRMAAVLGATFTLGTLPWFMFSQQVTGHWSQDSGAMKMLWAAKEQSIPGGPGHIVQALDYLRTFWFGRALKGLSGIPFSWLNPAEAMLVAMLLVAAFRYHRKRPEASTGWAAVLLLATSCVLSGMVYGLFFADTWQIWYLGEPGLVLYIICLIVVADHFANRPLNRWRSVAIDAAPVIGTILLSATWWLRSPISYPWQEGVYRSQPMFEAMIPPDLRIGCFNAGIPAYFSDRTILNLDGLVNSQAGSYWRAGTFDRYLRDYHIAYIIDEEKSLSRAARFSSAPLPLVSVDSVPLKDGPSDRHLWRVEQAIAGNRIPTRLRLTLPLTRIPLSIGTAFAYGDR